MLLKQLGAPLHCDRAAEFDCVSLSCPTLVPHAGGPPHLNNVTVRHFKPLLRKAKLPDMRLYDLRHSAATLRLANGEHVNIVSEMLGHASTTLTLDVYSHVLPEMQAASAARLDALLFPSTSVAIGS